MAPCKGAFQRWMLVLLAVLCLSLVYPSPVLADDVAVVVNPRLPLDDLSFSELRRILLGDRQYWSSGLRVTLLIPPISTLTEGQLIRASVAPEREVILRTVYRMSEAQFRKYWIAKVFRAEATAGPQIVYSNEMATDLVTVIPGSVSFVSAAKVPSGVKVLTVNGHLPGETDYPLR